MLRALMTTVVTLLMLAGAAPAEAQVVRIGGFGGVRVRGPGVAVDVGPYGGTRIRAPYTRVDSYGVRYPYGPGITYRRAVVGVPIPPMPPFGPVPPFIPVPPFGVVPPVVPVPVVPGVVYETYEAPPITAEGYQVTRPSLDGHVSEDLRRAAVRLQTNLSVRHDADVWLDYLGPARIIDGIDRGDAPSSLRDLISNYDGVVANSGLRAIYTVDGFNETRELLRVYVDLPAALASPRPEKGVNQQAPPPAKQPPAPEATERPIDAAEELPAPPPADSQEESGRVPPPPAPNPPAGPIAPTDV